METRTGQRHSTHLTDAQWAELEGFLDPPRDPSRGGRPQQYPRRRIADTVFYQLRTGVQWRLLPGDFPPWTAAWKQFCRGRDSGVWLPIMGHLLGSCREEAGRDPQPSAALLDAQSVPSGHLGPAKRSEQTAANVSEAGNDTCSPTSTACRSRSASPAPSPTSRAAAGACSKPRHRSSPGLPRCSPTPPTRPGRTCGCRTRRHGRHQATSRRHPLVRPAPAAVARRADLRLALPQPPAE